MLCRCTENFEYKVRAICLFFEYSFQLLNLPHEKNDFCFYFCNMHGNYPLHMTLSLMSHFCKLLPVNLVNFGLAAHKNQTLDFFFLLYISNFYLTKKIMKIYTLHQIFVIISVKCYNCIELYCFSGIWYFGHDKLVLILIKNINIFHKIFIAGNIKHSS